MSRRKKENQIKRQNIITFRLSNIELDALELAAANAGIPRSDYLRKLILETKIEIRCEVIADIEELKHLVNEYGKIGSNLNQIARYFNTGGERSLVMEDAIHQCISDLFELRKEVLKMTGDYYGSYKTHKK